MEPVVSLMGSLPFLAALFALVCAGFALVCASAVLLRPRGRTRLLADAPPVLLLRPAERVDAALSARLEADARAYGGPHARVACLGAPDALPEGVLLVTSGFADEAPSNRKALHLAAGLDASREHLGGDPIVVHADADVELAPGDLDALVATLLAARGPALAFAPPTPSGGTWLARAVIALSAQAFATVFALARYPLLERIVRPAPAIAGKLVAMRLSTLDRIGGYRAIAPHIADDVALVDAVVALGGEIAMSPRAARVASDARTPASLHAQLVRWFQVVRSHRPHLMASLPVLVAPGALVLACVAVLFGEDAQLALRCLGAFVGARVVLAAALAAGPYRGHVRADAAVVAGLLAPLVDAFVLSALFVSHLHREVRWAGRTYRLGPGGAILSVRMEPAGDRR
jgi:ceramide glucosyltransferase